MSGFLSNRSILAVVNGKTSSSPIVNSSFPHGYVVSPNLFLLFISDLLTSLSNKSVHIYISIFSSSSHFKFVHSLASRVASRFNLPDFILVNFDRIPCWVV